MIRGQDVGDERFFHFKIIRSPILPAHLSVHDDLTPDVACGLQQDRVHAHVRQEACRFGLCSLRTSHLKTILCDITVQGHVLALEGCSPVSVLTEDPAQRRHKKTFPGTGHRALDHDIACHSSSA